MKQRDEKIKWIREPKPNIFSRAFRMIFIMLIIGILLIGSSIRTEYNPERTKKKAKTWADHFKKAVETVRVIRPLF